MKKSELKLDCGDLPKEWVSSNGLKVVLIEDYAAAKHVAKTLKTAIAMFFMRSVIKFNGLGAVPLRRYYSIFNDDEIVCAFDILNSDNSRFISENFILENNNIPKKESVEFICHDEFMEMMRSMEGDCSLGYDGINVHRLLDKLLED